MEKLAPQNNHFIQVEVMEEIPGSANPMVSFENRVDFETFKKLPEGLWSPLVRKNFSIIQKAITISESLFRLGDVAGAATVSEAYELKNVIKEVKDISTKDEYSLFINTGIIDRYDSLWGNVGMTYIKDVYQHPIIKHEDIRKISEKRLSEAKMEKIIIAWMTLQLEAFYDKGEYLAGKSTVIILPKSQNNLKFIASCINSKLISFVYRELFGSLSLQGGYLRVGPPQIERIPIRRISFTTPPARRAVLVDDAKALYSEFCSGMANSDRINRMDRINSTTNPVNPVHPVQTGASFSAAPNSQKILDFVGERLDAKPEESDVVHDLLAHLAERMIGMNKEKNAEIKGFLRWLEGEIGAPVEELANKTALKEYYDPARSFESLVSALAKNKKKLREGYDPTRREPKEKLEKEFSASVEKIAPRLKRIEATDMLIDQIVYRLYGLNEDEIKIVEESILGNKDLNTKEDTKL